MKLTRITPINLDNGAMAGAKIAIATARSCTCTASAPSCSTDNIDEDDYVMSQDVAESLVLRTEKKVQDFLDKSQWVRKNSKLSEIPRFDADDLNMGKMIAEGGFSDVHEITSFHKESALTNTTTTGDDEKQYVVKHLKPELALNPHKMRFAAKDIFNEIHVLSALDHKHIVQLKGLSSSGISGFAETCRADSFFLVLERLDQSLLHRIPQWRHEGIKGQALSLHNLGNCQRTRKLFQDRIRTAQQIASALVYLHEHRILHRDIKPGNIAFDSDGCLKLIDFGLAVELPPTEDPNATFHLGNAGTARYQAPEVILKKPYNHKAETFSLTVVLWEMISLKKPYECLSCEEVKESVSQVGCRPSIPRSWPRALRLLLKRGWSKRFSNRPSMAEMEAALESIAQEDYNKKNSSSFSLFGF